MASVGDRRAIARQVRALLRRGRTDLPQLGRLRVGAREGIAIGFAVGVVAIAAKGGLNALLGGETGYILLIGATALAAWIGGIGGGLSATLTTAILNAAIFVGSAGPAVQLTRIDLARTLLFIIAGLVVSMLIDSLRASRNRLGESLADMSSMAADIDRRDERLEMVLAASGTGFWEWDMRSGDLTWSDAS